MIAQERPISVTWNSAPDLRHDHYILKTFSMYERLFRHIVTRVCHCFHTCNNKHGKQHEKHATQNTQPEYKPSLISLQKQTNSINNISNQL